MSKNRVEMQLEDKERRQVTLFAAICARRVLPIYEAIRPLDGRPREAIVSAEAFAAGGRRTAALRTSAWAAYAVAREVDDASAAHAAYAASHAAAAAYLHPIASPHQVKHILGAAVHQALAVELNALPRNDTQAASDEALRWAVSAATREVRDVLRRFTAPHRGSGRFGELLYALDAQLRE